MLERAREAMNFRFKAPLTLVLPRFVLNLSQNLLSYAAHKLNEIFRNFQQGNVTCFVLKLRFSQREVKIY